MGKTVKKAEVKKMIKESEKRDMKRDSMIHEKKERKEHKGKKHHSY